MCPKFADLLKKYEDYLNSLVSRKSDELFSNGGIEHASILMAILFNNTENEVRIFCEGFKPELITREPYNSSLKNFISKGNTKISILLENDTYKDKDYFKEINNNSNVKIKQINQKSKKTLFNKLNSDHCNFSIFDNDKFRFEYNPEEYKAFGSFNQPDKCKQLINLFDEEFSIAKIL